MVKIVLEAGRSKCGQKPKKDKKKDNKNDKKKD
jgi:hypothetical protein